MAIGQLTVGVAANAAKGISALKGFRKEVVGVKADCNQASKAVASMGSIVTKFGTALVGSMAAYASTRTFLRIAGDIDTLNDQSERLGVTAQRLQELRHAAKMTGVEADLLDKSVGKLNLNIAQAAVGTGAGRDALKELGVAVKDLHALSPDRQFHRIAAAMEGVSSQSDKARLAVALFGKEGRALLPTLDLGAKGLGKLAAEQRSLMGTISAAEIAKVAEFNDEMDKLSTLLGGVGRELVIDIAPAATEAIKALQEVSHWIRGRDSKGRDATNAGQLTDDEKLAANKRVSEDKFRHSTNPVDVHQRMVRAANRGNAIRAGRAFDDNTVGVAKKAIGEGVAGLVNLVGKAKSEIDKAAAVIRRRPAHVNALTGLAPLGMSEARKALMEGTAGGAGRITDRINDLVSADSSEGYMALRANQRQAKLNPIDKSAPRIETNTAETAAAVNRLLEFFKMIPPPRRI